MSLLSQQSALQAWLAGEHKDAPIATVLGAPDEALRRLGVYHHAYRARLGDVLRELYDKTWSYLGDEAFDAAVTAHIETTPSTSPSLDDYGADFPERLETLWPDAPEVIELARLEWDMRRAFDGPDAEPIPADRLAALSADDWDRARLTFLPTLKVRPALTNVGALWSVLDAGEGEAPAPLEAPLAVRVWRQDLQPHFRMIAAAEAEALFALSAGATFSELCRLTLDAEGADGLDRLSAVLAGWIEDGLVVSVA